MPIYPAVRYRFAVPVLPTRASHLLSLLPHVFPPRRLPPRFSRRFPVCQHPYRFPTCLRRRPSLPCSCHQIEHAHLYRLRLPYRLWSPHRRPDIAAARSSRRMAPRRAGMVSMACPFGAYRHGSRWCSSDIPDAVPYVRSRRSSGQRIPDTDMEAREVGGMQHACRDPYRLRYRARGHIAFPAKNPPVQFRPVRSGAYHIIGMGMALPRVLESRSGHRPWRLGASPRIAGRRGGRGENRMSLEDTWHVAR